jgi:hypothetical protein
MTMHAQDSTHPTGVSGDSGKSKGSNTAVARRRKSDAALQMALASATWEEIALALGYPTPRAARVAVENALVKRLDAEQDREKMRTLVSARLNRLTRAVWTKAIDPDHPDQLLAVSKARELIADHRKLYGLDAPSEVVVHNPTRDELESWVTKLIGESVPQVEEYDIIAGEWSETPTPAVEA